MTKISFQWKISVFISISKRSSKQESNMPGNDPMVLKQKSIEMNLSEMYAIKMQGNARNKQRY